MRLSKSVLGEEEVLAVKKVILENGYLGMGSEVQKFEGDIADYLGIKSKNVTCVSSGTAALHLALEAVLKPGDEVLVPSLTYLSSYQSISAAGCIPVSCEVYEDTLTIDIEDANNKITKNTRAIMPVHYASNLVDLEKIFDLAKFNNLRIIESVKTHPKLSVTSIKYSPLDISIKEGFTSPLLHEYEYGKCPPSTEVITLALLVSQS